MRFLFFDGPRLRSGWKALGFLLLTVLFGAPLLALHRLLPDGVRHYVPGSWVAFLAALLATALCLRRERQRLASVGFRLDLRFARQLGAGVVGGLGLVALSTGLVWLAGGFHFVRVPEAQVGLLVRSALVMLGVGLVEETVFHGYAFQRLIQGLGPLWAQLVVAGLFALGHPVADLPPATLTLAVVNTLLAGVLFGLCFLRTGSLALPVGLHMGWNWSLGALGVPVSGVEAKGWWAPVQHAGREWLTGGTYGLEASPVDLAVLLIAIGALWLWRGSTEPLVDAATAPAPAAR